MQRALLVVFFLGCSGNSKTTTSTSGGNGNNGSNGTNALGTLSNLVPTAANAACPAGGVTLQTGKDANGNGTLDANEVTASQEVCNGSSYQFSQLTLTTTLNEGDLHCLFGGSETQVGFDDGSAGGTANDGVLQNGEVRNTTYSCNATIGLNIGVMTPPTSPTPGDALNTAGGPAQSSGATQVGGAGGPVSLQILGDSGGGHVKVFKTGSTAASGSGQATLPAAPTPRAPSANDHIIHVTVSNSPLNIASYAIATASGGVPGYFTLSDGVPAGLVYQSPSVGVLVQMTGMLIDAGAIVNFTKNGTGTSVGFPGDIINNGTMFAYSGGPAGTSLWIGCASYFGSATSLVEFRGGPLTIVADDIIYNQGVLTSSTTLYNYGAGVAGVIPTPGPPNAGTPGSLTLTSYFGEIYNDTGAYLSTNGSQTAQAGGALNLNAALAVYNAGTFTTNGAANTAAAASGASGAVTVVVNDTQYPPGGAQPPPTYSNNGGLMQFINSGLIDTSGILCTANHCSGGAGGAINVTVSGGPTLATSYVAIGNSGQLNTRGGNAAYLLVGSTGANGGAGGAITLTSNAQSAAEQLGNVSNAAGSIYLSGGISLGGGTGDNGGIGGEFKALLTPGVANGQEIVLLGYDNITTIGGDGVYTPSPSISVAGNAGKITMTNVGGGVINYADLFAHGGANGTNKNFGQGAPLIMSAGGGDFAPAVSPAQVVINYGQIDLTGGSTIAAGSQDSSGSYGGQFQLIGAARVENHHTIDASCGSGAGVGTNGNGYASVLSSGGGPVVNDHALSANGGSPTKASDASAAQSITLIGTQVQNSANISSAGGSAEGLGGDGNNIALISTNPATPTTLSSGTLLNVSAGVGGFDFAGGSRPSQNGAVIIDNEGEALANGEFTAP